MMRSKIGQGLIRKIRVANLFSAQALFVRKISMRGGIVSVILVSTCFIFACTKDQAVQTDSASGAQELSEVILEGPWVIALFIDDGDDETDSFEDYSFSFQAGGNIVATSSQGGQEVQGTWRSRFDDGRVQLTLDFTNGGEDFDELEEDWYLIEANDDRIRLEYDDDDDDLYLLTFERL
jgi:hypothetical protein